MYLSTDYRSLMNFSIKHTNEKLFGQFINNKKKECVVVGKESEA